jgi:hypothetical protein
MYLTTSAVIAIIGFRFVYAEKLLATKLNLSSASTFANIFPDPDPCNPYPPLQGEYRGEFGKRNSNRYKEYSGC